MKQQGWLPKIVPQPKEVTAPCPFKDPGAVWWWRSKTLTFGMMRSQCLHPTRSALPTTRRLLPPRKREGGKVVQRCFRGSSDGWRQAVREMGGGSSDAEASSCLDEANHSLTLARARRKVCVHLAVHHWAEQTSTAGEQFFSGSKGPTIAWCPAMVERWVFAATLTSLSTLPTPCQ
jgi:hypothetical protein